MRPTAPWQIIDVELADGIGRFAPAVDGPALVIFRYRGAVLGQVHLLPTDLPMSGGEFAALAARSTCWTARELARLGAADGRITFAGAPPGAEALRGDPGLLGRLDAALAERRARPITVTASIVICTRHRAGDLADCLAAVAPEIAAGREVVVVDNGPDPATEAAVSAAPGVHYVVEPVPGLNRARNAGLRAARGDVAVFVDDDVRPEAGWVEELLRGFDAPNVGVVCGLVLPEALDTEAQIGFQYELGFGGMRTVPMRFDHGFLRGWRWGAPIWEIGAGANMAIRRELALELGGFDERVGPGGAGGSGDDTEFWHHVLHRGGVAKYEPLAVVRHRHRRTWPELKRQAYGYGRGHVVSLFVTYARAGAASDLARIFVLLPIWYGVRIARAPIRWLLGEPDRLLPSSLIGYLSSFRHIGLAFPRSRREPADVERGLAGAGRAP